MYVFFFFQAEDGIRDWSVTGVQTCALPIFARDRSGAAVADRARLQFAGSERAAGDPAPARAGAAAGRRGDGGDGGDAGGGGGAAAADGREGDPEQVGGDAGGGGRDAGSVAAA